jgi:hypothetical protein
MRRFPSSLFTFSTKLKLPTAIASTRSFVEKFHHRGTGAHRAIILGLFAVNSDRPKIFFARKHQQKM